MFAPMMAWEKALVTGDNENDNTLKWKDNLTVYWHIKDKDNERRGMFTGFYLNDPLMPTISGAMTIAAGATTTAVFVYSTLV
jgi:hypothetical protein